MDYSEEFIDRFWSLVDKNGECWIWLGGDGKPGRTYGHIIINGKSKGVHRVAYELTYGPIPEGLLVCHRCDNAPCVRPTHLFTGTYRDNTRDMTKKKRSRLRIVINFKEYEIITIWQLSRLMKRSETVARGWLKKNATKILAHKGKEYIQVEDYLVAKEELDRSELD